MRKKPKIKKRKVFAETYRDVETALKINLSDDWKIEHNSRLKIS